MARGKLVQVHLINGMGVFQACVLLLLESLCNRMVVF